MPIIIYKTCLCCGSEFSGPQFSTKGRKYCGHACYAKTTLIDLTGKKFGRLTVIGRAHGKHWSAICDCGGTAVSSGQSLREGKTKSCGCLGKEQLAEGRTKHSGSKRPEYKLWSGIIQRCTNPNNKHYRNYGGRGISVCDRWKDFANFFSDIGARPSKELTIDRTNNDGNYEPGNVRWATRKQQQNNRRNSIKISGE